MLNDEDIAALQAFYNVDSDEALIDAMHRQIVKLQTKLRQIEKPDPAVMQVRS